MPSKTNQSTSPVPGDNTPQAFPRKELERPLIVLNAQDSQSRTFFGYARNISVGGMRIAATSPRDPGARYCLEIPLPEPVGAATQCECEVVWKRDYSKGDCMGPGMGLRFLNLPEEVSEALDAWIRGEDFYGRCSQ